MKVMPMKRHKILLIFSITALFFNTAIYGAEQNDEALPYEIKHYAECGTCKRWLEKECYEQLMQHFNTDAETLNQLRYEFDKLKQQKNTSECLAQYHNTIFKKQLFLAGFLFTGAVSSIGYGATGIIEDDDAKTMRGLAIFGGLTATLFNHIEKLQSLYATKNQYLTTYKKSDAEYQYPKFIDEFVRDNATKNRRLKKKSKRRYKKNQTKSDLLLQRNILRAPIIDEALTPFMPDDLINIIEAYDNCKPIMPRKK